MSASVLVEVDCRPIDPAGQFVSGMFPHTLDCWARLDGRLRLVLGRDGRILACGDESRAWLLSAPEFRIIDGRLEITNLHHRHAFTKILAVINGSRETLLLPSNAGSGHLICRATVVHAAGGEVVALSIQPATGEFRPQWADVRDAFDLTESEHQVLHRLLEGCAPAEIAALQQLSVNTVRTHIRHVFDKVGVKSTQELSRRLCGYRIF